MSTPARSHRSTPTVLILAGGDGTAVSDTDRSLAFYRDALGMEIAGTSENYGPEQEQLNAVFGARLPITAVRAESGLGIEFLEYLSPRDGRPMPDDEHANDLVHWQTQLATRNVTGLAMALRERKVAFVSPGVIALPGRTLGFSKGLSVRDPDGHVMQLVEP